MVNDLKSKVIIKGNSQCDPSHMHPLKAGIILQLETIRVEMTTQRKVDNNNLISKVEEREKILMAERVQTMYPRKKLNQIKIKMAHLEWYNKICKTKGIGYYDCYKNQLGSSDREIARAFGASDIIAVDVQDEKLEKAKTFGATATINSKIEDPIERINVCGCMCL
uniref:Alcohol dehydrogenase-like C-terminal domain-containing protein n=1 Tax=Salix viminalis TaxID=40686 RepID=A0A6N2KRV9_SALVM